MHAAIVARSRRIAFPYPTVGAGCANVIQVITTGRRALLRCCMSVAKRNPGGATENSEAAARPERNLMLCDV